MDLALPVAVVLALICGYVIGRVTARRKQAQQPRLSADYYKGINYLLNEKPDKALEIFLRLVEVDKDTVETHITLGKLFRRKGEVENAIRVHQNLIARPSISSTDRSLALLELGKDYLSAGVLDRAEGLFKEVCDAGTHRVQAQRALRDIYVQQHEWPAAIEVSKAYARSTGKNQDKLIAHYYCELARREKKNNNLDTARSYLHQAHDYDAHSLRANYMSAELDCEQTQYLDALHCYVQVIEIDSRYAVEVLPKIQRCLEHIDNKRIKRQVDSLFERLRDEGVYVQPLTRQIRETEGLNEAKHYLENIMDKQPGLEPLRDWLALHPVSVSAEAMDKQLLKLGSSEHTYQCEQCGYNSRRIQWHCPSCAHWGSIFPAYR